MSRNQVIKTKTGLVLNMDYGSCELSFQRPRKSPQIIAVKTRENDLTLFDSQIPSKTDSKKSRHLVILRRCSQLAASWQILEVLGIVSLMRGLLGDLGGQALTMSFTTAM
jgi:hypothetical protein